MKNKKYSLKENTGNAIGVSTDTKEDNLQSFFDFFFGQLDLPLFTKIDAPIRRDNAKENHSVVKGVAQTPVRKD